MNTQSLQHELMEKREKMISRIEEMGQDFWANFVCYDWLANSDPDTKNISSNVRLLLPSCTLITLDLSILEL